MHTAQAPPGNSSGGDEIFAPSIPLEYWASLVTGFVRELELMGRIPYQLTLPVSRK
jgi:hypothetical protein